MKFEFKDDTGNDDYLLLTTEEHRLLYEAAHERLTRMISYGHKESPATLTLLHYIYFTSLDDEEVGLRIDYKQLDIFASCLEDVALRSETEEGTAMYNLATEMRSTLGQLALKAPEKPPTIL